MKDTLKQYIKELQKEYERCVKIDNKLTENRSDNYYYHTRAELIREIINDLYDIIVLGFPMRVKLLKIKEE